MYRQEIVIATTQVDAHDERFAPGALVAAAEDVNAKCLPMWVQHDPRIPPIGRVVRAEVRQVGDGEFELIGEVEIWEPGDEVEFWPTRTMPVKKPDHEQIYLGFDRGFKDNESQSFVGEIAQLLGTPPQVEIKKALEPLSVLTLGGTFVAGAVAAGFFGQIGAKSLDLLISKLQALLALRRSKPSAGDLLFLFKALVADGKGLCEVDIYITNPNEDDIRLFFTFGLAKLDKILPSLLENRRNVTRAVIEMKDGELHVRFGVRSDAVPVAVLALPAPCLEEHR